MVREKIADRSLPDEACKGVYYSQSGSRCASASSDICIHSPRPTSCTICISTPTNSSSARNLNRGFIRDLTRILSGCLHSRMIYSSTVADSCRCSEGRAAEQASLQIIILTVCRETQERFRVRQNQTVSSLSYRFDTDLSVGPRWCEQTS